jgi:hypothetical protein
MAFYEQEKETGTSITNNFNILQYHQRIFSARGFVLGLTWSHASSHHRLIDESLSNTTIRRLSVRTYVSPIVFLVLIPASSLLARFTPALCVLVWPLNSLVARFYRVATQIASPSARAQLTCPHFLTAVFIWRIWQN